MACLPFVPIYRPRRLLSVVARVSTALSPPLPVIVLTNPANGLISHPLSSILAQMNFTPQQLAGGASYNCKTRVGNWHEDVCLQETKFADFKRAR